MKILTKIEILIFESSVQKLILLVFAITFFKTGVWYIPNLAMPLAIAQNPFANPFSDPHAHVLLWSWLGPFMAWAIGAKSLWAFFLLHFAFSLAFSLLFIKIVFSRFSDQTARSSLILFCALPVSATAYFWVGTDSITLFLMLLSLAYPRYALVTFMVGIGLGMQHFEQGFFAAGGLLFAGFLNRKYDDSLRYSVKFPIFLILGVLVGKLILIGLFKHYSIDVNSGRIYWLQEHFHFLLDQFVFHIHQIVWAVLGLGWLAALKYSDAGRKTRPFFMALFGLCLLLPIVEDQTRVLAIVTFPLIAVYWLFNDGFLQKISRNEIALIFLLWVMMPWSWIWGGTAQSSVFPHDIAYLLKMSFGVLNVPADPSLWPFIPPRH